MSSVLGIDHVVLTASDLDCLTPFYERVFGAKTVANHQPQGPVLVRKLKIGTALLSVHQNGNGVELVAKKPTVGGADICLLWDGPISTAVGVMQHHNVPIVEGPSPRSTAEGRPSQSLYFRDPDGNLIELMAESGNPPAHEGVTP